MPCCSARRLAEEDRRRSIRLSRAKAPGPTATMATLVASNIRSMRMLSQPPKGGWRGTFSTNEVTTNSTTNSTATQRAPKPTSSSAPPISSSSGMKMPKNCGSGMPRLVTTWVKPAKPPPKNFSNAATTRIRPAVARRMVMPQAGESVCTGIFGTSPSEGFRETTIPMAARTASVCRAAARRWKIVLRSLDDQVRQIHGCDDAWRDRAKPCSGWPGLTTSVDAQDLAADEASALARQKRDCAGNLHWIAVALQGAIRNQAARVKRATGAKTRCQHATGRNHIDRHVVRPELDGKTARVFDHGGLRGRIHRSIGGAVQAVDAGSGDDAALAPLHDLGRHGPATQNARDEIPIEYGVHVLERDEDGVIRIGLAGVWCTSTSGADISTCTRDQDVDGSQLVVDLRDDPLNGVGLGKVAVHRCDFRVMHIGDLTRDGLE